MDPLGNAVLGIVFLIVGGGSTFLMFHLWGYPFDHETHTSEAPRPLMLLHRALGWVYLLMYLYFMSQMVPRLWSYQIEFPARTVAHIILAMSIGTILVIKVAIVRFFKHLESTLVPFLGTFLLVCTVLMIGLSAPFAFQEAYWRASAVDGTVFSQETLQRVERHLAVAGVTDPDDLAMLATPEALHEGQQVLAQRCITCHDLRTVLAQPRTPQSWRTTVRRMAERSSMLAPITEDEEWHVTAYLIAISPELQRSVKERRAEQQEEESSQAMLSEMVQQPAAPEAAYDPQQARALFEERCSLCHGSDTVANAPPSTELEVRDTVARMVGYGLSGTESELRLIIRYLTETYAD